jgi:hypothetical protein
MCAGPAVSECIRPTIVFGGAVIFPEMWGDGDASFRPETADACDFIDVDRTRGVIFIGHELTSSLTRVLPHPSRHLEARGS